MFFNMIQITYLIHLFVRQSLISITRVPFGSLGNLCIVTSNDDWQKVPVLCCVRYHTKMYVKENIPSVVAAHKASNEKSANLGGGGR